MQTNDSRPELTLTDAAASSSCSCCGGGSATTSDTNLESATGSHEHADSSASSTALTGAAASGAVTAVYEVNGMTCGHCVSSVTEEVSGLAGVDDVRVNLVAGGTSTVTVTSASALSEEAVSAAIEEAGYELVSATR